MDFKRFFQKVANNDVSREESLNPLQNEVRKFSLRELRVATDNFNSKNILGRGGFGVVYKGCLADGSIVAIKRILNEKSNSEGILQFQREVEMISMALHKNLLKLQGFCINSKERLLVYPFMANGSVASRLKGRQESQSSLGWNTRKRVAYGAAMALAYLHDNCSPKIIHRDVKADNILLDEEFEAVVGDFGLAKLISYEESHATTGVCGTIGHIAPEYFINLRCSDKTDVYGYGILLLELVTGRKVYDIVPPSKRDEVFLFDWINEILIEKKLDLLIDSDLHLSSRNQNLYPEAEGMIHVALQCTQRSPKERPKMSNVVRMLDDHGLFGVNVIKRRVFDDRLKELDPLEIFGEALLGKGSLRTVYKATLDDGHSIAIKRLTKDKIHRANNFEHYLDLMGKVKHPHILKFGAYYKLDEEEFLVYDYLPNGSMYSYAAAPLRGPKGIPLDWLRRLHSLKEAAQGLNYIHQELNAVHGNMKSSNVLFDIKYNTYIQLEIPDDVFPLSSVYTAPEQSLSQEADVYGFGVLFLEYLTAAMPSEIHSSNFANINEEWAVYFPKWVWSTFGADNCIFNTALEVGLRCVARSPEDRPKMAEVISAINDVVRHYFSRYNNKVDYELEL